MCHFLSTLHTSLNAIIYELNSRAVPTINNFLIIINFILSRSINSVREYKSGRLDKRNPKSLK